MPYWDCQMSNLWMTRFTKIEYYDTYNIVYNQNFNLGLSFYVCTLYIPTIILLTKTSATQNEVALSYHRLRGLYFLAVVFVAAIV